MCFINNKLQVYFKQKSNYVCTRGFNKPKEGGCSLLAGVFASHRINSDKKQQTQQQEHKHLTTSGTHPKKTNHVKHFGKTNTASTPNTINRGKKQPGSLRINVCKKMLDFEP